jgi:hypothetical protein
VGKNVGKSRFPPKRCIRCEGERQAAVECEEFQPIEHKGHRHDGVRAGVSEASDPTGFRVLEDRSVEMHGLRGLVVEPQKWGNLLYMDLRCPRQSSLAGICGEDHMKQEMSFLVPSQLS